FALYSDRRYLPAKTRALIDFMQQKLSNISFATTNHVASGD
ncbi:hypothetical protein ACBQ19_09570, partial [Hafnia alvei]